MSEAKDFTLLPVYLVLDTSASMTEDNAFEAAFEFVPRMLREMNKSSVIADMLRIEVITFDEKARVVFPLGSRDSLDSWYQEKKINPIQPDGSWTIYSQAFEKLREQIESGVQQITSEVYDNQNYQSNRPVVFFVTDGFPNGDTESALESTFSRLTDPDFKYRPNIVCIGVGKATADDLRRYGAGRYRTQSKQYETGNENLVLVAKDGVAPGAALAQIIPALVQSIVSATGSAQVWDSDDTTEIDDISDAFGTITDFLPDDEDDLADLLAQVSQD